MANRIVQAWKALTGSPNLQVRATVGGVGDAAINAFLRGESDGFGSKSFQQVVEKTFEQNVVGYRCITMIASSIGSLEWYLRKGDDELYEHPLLDLINRPNPIQGKGSFFTHVEGSKLLDGNSFVETVGPINGPPKELWALRPDCVEVVQGAKRLPLQYIYNPGGQASKVYPVDPITGKSPLLHMMSYNPLYETSMGRGLSPMRSAWLSLLTHTEGQRWNYALLKNGARPSGAFVEGKIPEGSGGMTQEQVDILRREITEMYSGSSNSGKPMLLTGGIDFREMSLSPKDMDHLQSKNSVSRDIALALGVPPPLLGIPGDNTYSNYKEARMAFYEDTILPRAYDLRDELNRWLVPMFGDGLELCIDEDTIPALEPKREAKFARANTATFLTENEKREMVGYDNIGPEGDVIYKPSSLLPLGSDVDDSELE